MNTPSPCIATLTDTQIRYGHSATWVPSSPVTLSVPRGSFTVLLGPSGCGKSTLTHLISGVVPHSIASVYMGDAQVFDEEVAQATVVDLATKIAVVLQDPDTQIVTTRVWDEVAFALENLCLPREEICARVWYALQAMGIDDYAQADPWTLSGGQRQRVLLASALAQRPQVLILDEPTANVDTRGAREFYRLLASIRAAGTTVLAVEHTIDYFIDQVDHVVAFDTTGHILCQGTPHHVFVETCDLLQRHGIAIPTTVKVSKSLQAAHVDLTKDNALTCLEQWRPHTEATVIDPVVADVNARWCPRTEATVVPQVDAPRALVVDKLRVTRAQYDIITDVSFDVAEGELVAIIGTNGSGKTTLLRTLVGLERVTSGTIRYTRQGGNANIAATLVTQNPEHQFVTNSVQDELAHTMRIQRRHDDDIATTVDTLLRSFDLKELRHANPFTLSGGQKRRLSVAAALSTKGTFLCLDEPTFGQDHKNAHTLMMHMRNFTLHGGSALFATHDIDMAAHYADKIAVIAQGRIVAYGPTPAIVADPHIFALANIDPSVTLELAWHAHYNGNQITALYAALRNAHQGVCAS